jgi:spermidine synthase
MQSFSFYPLFFILSAVSGFLVGAEFPLANKLCAKDFSTGKTAGALYALDLLGAFFAALLISAIFIPVFGVLETCLFLAVIKSAGLILYLNTNLKTSN